MRLERPPDAHVRRDPIADHTAAVASPRGARADSKAREVAGDVSRGSANVVCDRNQSIAWTIVVECPSDVDLASNPTAASARTNDRIFCVEIGDESRALAAYEKAAEWFEGDNAEA